MSELQTTLDNILADKNANLTPENLRAGITALGVEGTYLGESSTDIPVKLFATIDEMNASMGNEIDDLALAYGKQTASITATTTFQAAEFPQIVTLPTAFSESTECYFRTAVETGGWFDCRAQLSNTEFRMFWYGETGEGEVTYTSTDGITYNRTDTMESIVDFGQEIKCYMPEMWNDAFGYFIKSVIDVFGGLYTYQNYTDTNKIILTKNPNYISGTGATDEGLFVSDKYHIIKTILADISSKRTYARNILLTYDESTNTYYAYGNTDSAAINGIMIDRYQGNHILLHVQTSTGLTSMSLYKFTLDLDNVTYTEEILNSSEDIGVSTDYKYFWLDDSTDKYVGSINVNSVEQPMTTILLYEDSDSSSMRGQAHIFTDYGISQKYFVAPSQLNVADDTVLVNKAYYGPQGPSIGTLGTNVQASLKDGNYQVWKKIQEQYDTPYFLAADEGYMLYNRFEDAEIPQKLDTSNTSDLSFMFNYAENLTNVDNVTFNTENVTSMCQMFGGCHSLTHLDLSGFNTSKVTDMSNMLSGCGKLTTLDLSSFNTSNVTDMSNMFGTCASLTSLDLSNFDSSKVTDTQYMFHYCTKLTTLDISNMVFTNVTESRWMFDGCTALQTVYVKDQAAKTFIDAQLAEDDLTITSIIKT